MSRRKGGSARTPKKGRSTPRQADVVRRDGGHYCDDTDDLWSVGVALTWLLKNPEYLPKVKAIRDAAITAVFGEADPVGEDGVDVVATTYFDRLALCSVWVADRRKRDESLASSDGPLDWDSLAVLFDVPTAVEAWKAGRTQSIAEESHREARRALRAVRTPADIPVEDTP